MQTTNETLVHKDKRGEIIELTKGIAWRQLNKVISKKGEIRGNHYHKETYELVYLIKGLAEVKIFNVKTKKTKEFILHEEKSFIIEPYDVHTIKPLKDSCWLILLSKEFDPEDTYNYDPVEQSRF